MLVGLDAEIHAVRRVLNQPRDGDKRLSLTGVRGASSPEDAATYVPTSGFLPIEVNLRTGSIDRLVELLAGETLYGPNPMAAVRELVQNARDAVMLKAEVAASEAELATLTIPIRLSLNTKNNPPVLEVLDHGIGMSRKVITDFLITLASDYWGTQFASDFPQAAEKGFKSAGKFGIGFLSIFMLGDEITVETNRAGGERFRLSVRGVGRRGELRRLPSPAGSGTSIRINLKPSALEGITPLEKLAAIYAPTLPHSLVVEINGERHNFPVRWLNNMEVENFLAWIADAIDTMQSRNLPNSPYPNRRRDLAAPFEDFLRFSFRHHLRERPKKSPWSLAWPEYRNGNTRLVASFYGISLLCLRGLAIQPVATPGFNGVIELDSAALEVSRNRTVNTDLTNVLDAARQSVSPQITQNLNELGKSGFVVEKMEFLATCVRLYGAAVLLNSEIRWISQITAPGNVAVISCSELLTSLSTYNSVFITFNTGPWTAMRQWETSEPAPSDNEISILINGKGQLTPSYRPTDQGRNAGNLERIWKECMSSPLFATLLGIVAQAWQVSPEQLMTQNGWIHERDEVRGRFNRP